MSEERETRLALVREILRSESVSNQGHLVELLAHRGYAVTQSSISRDLRELRVAKVGGRYQLPVATNDATSAFKPSISIKNESWPWWLSMVYSRALGMCAASSSCRAIG